MRPVIPFLLVIALATCTSREPDPTGPSKGTVSFRSGATLDVRIADEPDEQRRGLMGVTSLHPNEGMAFEYAEPTDGTFWMKDTLIPLSIAFVGHDDRIVTILEMKPCPEEPCPTYAADGPYVLAVEANAGWFHDHGIAEGDVMEEFVGPAFQ